MARKRKRRRQPRVRLAFARGMLKVPLLRRFYVKRVLRHLDETPKSQLPPELEQLQTLLARVPRGQRQAALETALRQGLTGESPQAQLSSRSLRRTAARQQRRLGR